MSVYNAWRESNAGDIKAKYQQYYLDNRDKFIERAKQAYRQNKEVRKQQITEWRKRNPEKILAYGRKHRLKNPEAAKVNWHKRRARIRGAQFVEHVDRLKVFERDGWICKLCGEPLERSAKKPHPMAPSVDHIVPLSMGGEHSYANCQAAHLRCNIQKGNVSRCKQHPSKAGAAPPSGPDFSSYAVD